MTMGLHDDDVAFFLAADEPATYLQVLRLPFAPSQLMWAAFSVLCCRLASGAKLQLEEAAAGLASDTDRGPYGAAMLSHVQQCKAWPETRGMS